MFCQLAGVQYIYLSQNAERTLLGHLSASAIFNNLLPCRCKNFITKLIKLYEHLSNIIIKKCISEKNAITFGYCIITRCMLIYMQILSFYRWIFRTFCRSLNRVAKYNNENDSYKS